MIGYIMITKFILKLIKTPIFEQKYCKMSTEDIKYRTGTMTKLPHQMSEVELKNWEEQGKKEVRDYLFSINQPMVYFKDNMPIVEHKNGEIENLV